LWKKGYTPEKKCVIFTTPKKKPLAVPPQTSKLILLTGLIISLEYLILAGNGLLNWPAPGCLAAKREIATILPQEC
jgi:hypothetical protein